MITRQVADYIAGALDRPLPDAAMQSGVEHFLDTVASIVAGATLPVGPLAQKLATTLGGSGEATVIGTALGTDPISAARANGIMAHADETDDSHAPSITHPGCSVVPAALAAGEYFDRSGRDVIRATVLGYDIGTRLAATLGGGQFFDHYNHSSHAFGGYFGACAAASALAGLSSKQAEYALAYCVQQVSGIPCWYRDSEHMEKAYQFGGMPAEGGVTAAMMALNGFSGSAEPLEGVPGLFSVFPDKCDPARMTAGLGERFAVQETTIKKWSVGSPIQAALDSLQLMMRDEGLTPDNFKALHIVLPPRRALAVDGRDMPAVNIQHQLSLLLLDGNVTFASGHDEDRMHNDPRIAELRRRITVEGDPGQPEGGTAHLHATLTDGRTLYRHTRWVRGTPNNPMTLDEITGKARDIMAATGRAETQALIDMLTRIDSLPSIRTLGRALRSGAA